MGYVQSSSSEFNNRNRIPYVDGLRAIAVLAVLAYHLEMKVITNGFLGVDLFFVISGYVVCLSLMASAQTGITSISYLERFYRRRFWRLIPALSVMILVTAILTVLFIPPVYLARHIIFTAAGALTGVANFVLAFASDANYFDSATGYNPFIHSWSLGIEEQFYLVFPFLIWMSVKRTYLSSSLTILAISSFLLSMSWSSSNQSDAFYLLPARFWELALGALAFRYAAMARRIITGRYAVAAGWAGLVLVMSALVWPIPVVTPFPGAIVPNLGMVMVIWYATPENARFSFSSAGYWLSGRVLVYVGKIYYSLYLWHWPVIVMMRWTIGYANMFHLGLAVFLSFALAALSYHFIEQPFQRNKRSKNAMTPFQFVSIGAFVFLLPMIVLSLGNGRGYATVTSLGQLSVVKHQFGWANTELPNLGRQVLQDFQYPKPSMIVIGDSHAGHLTGAATAVANKIGLRLQIRATGCKYNLFMPVIDKSCEKILDDAQIGDVVVFSSLNVPRFSEDVGSEKTNTKDKLESQELALLQFIDIARDLKGRGIAVVYRGPEPLFRFVPYRCSDWFNVMNPICDVKASESRSDLLARAKPNTDGITIAAQKIPSLVVWDVFDRLCPGQECSVFDEDGHPLFVDNDHLTGWGAERLVNSLEDAVMLARSKATQ